MKNPFYPKALLCILILLLLQSCSIQKRRYTGGFHIEWHNEKKINDEVAATAEQHVDKSLQSDFASFESQPNGIESIEDTVSQVDQALCLPKHESPIEKHHRKSTLAILRHPQVAAPIVATKSIEENNAANQMHQGAKSSLILMLLSYLLVVLSVAFLFASATTYVFTLTQLVATLFFFVSASVATVITTVASVRAMYSIWEIGRTPETYSNRWQAILATILGIFYLNVFFVIPLFIFLIKVKITKNKEKTEGKPIQPGVGSHE